MPKLYKRYIAREREILAKNPLIRRRNVPVALFRKLLDAADFYLEHKDSYERTSPLEVKGE